MDSNKKSFRLEAQEDQTEKPSSEPPEQSQKADSNIRVLLIAQNLTLSFLLIGQITVLIFQIRTGYQIKKVLSKIKISEKKPTSQTPITKELKEINEIKTPRTREIEEMPPSIRREVPPPKL